MDNNAEYWNKRYVNGYTGWDVGSISTPLKEYFDQLVNKDIRILIPGSGNGYEAEYLLEKGFRNVFLLDWSELALENFSKRNPYFPEKNPICGNFFEHKNKYDLIIEQTFFCAINPSERKKYAEKIYELLTEKGKLSGLLFNCDFEGNEPPFGGNEVEYKSYFSKLFTFMVFDKCYNSIKQRSGRELFIILEKK
jgi:SAM-dependent methyltransferase